MPTLTQHAPGTFCWPELYTTDQNAAKAFYTKLFGWGVKEIPMGPGAAYVIFTNQDQDCAACYGKSPEMEKMGVPPHWMAYVSVESADQAAKQVKAAGGKVLKEPFDVMSIGRMAALQDPTGASFCVWESKGHIGVGILDEPGALTWTELMTTDIAKAGAFYKGVFGWGEQQMPMPTGQTYTVFTRGEAMAGGMMVTPKEAEGMPPCWTSYFMVEDCDGTVKKATSLGARTLVPATDIPNIGRFAVFSDPAGAPFAVIQYVKKS